MFSLLFCPQRAAESHGHRLFNLLNLSSSGEEQVSEPVSGCLFKGRTLVEDKRMYFH